MGDSLQISPKAFQALSPEARVDSIRQAMGEACRNNETSQYEVTCHLKARSIASFLSPFPESMEGTILSGLSETQRKTLFQIMARDKNPPQMADMLCHMHAAFGAEALAQLPRSQREPVLSEIRNKAMPQSTALLAHWEILMSDPAVARQISGIDDREAVQTMPDGDLMTRFFQKRGLDAIGLMEISRRKARANSAATNAGFVLPEKHDLYRKLKMDFYVNGSYWALSGELQRSEGQWVPFRYVAQPNADLQQLWLDGQMIFPSEAQDLVLHGKIFPQAVKTIRQIPAKDRPQTASWPEDFGPLHFERVDLPFHPVKKVPDPKIPLSIQNLRSGRVRLIEQKAEKPVWSYYLSGEGGRSVTLAWDENEDMVRTEVFMGTEQSADPQWSGIVDDRKARSLLAILEKMRPSHADRPQFKRLIKKLAAIADYR
ncbi:MAG: hypothetical protein Q7T11_04480 [Deltaproteobacteria bacterium]|nr:hypothetical protein [Deltaproteobacteria bacterium]